ncbi:MAG: methyltransferase [Bacteroidales bacterium]|nr:methyltransferase [Bacteroidales bacterium]
MASFYFKKFVVEQSNSAMKVNTDGVLLAAWVSLDAPVKLLDIGSGTGVISLIIAQRLEEILSNNFNITAIDVDYNSYLESYNNFKNSIWSDNLEALHISLQDLYLDYKSSTVGQGKFNLILSNPPFFTNSLPAPSKRRNIARHNHSLPLELLLESSTLLLKEGGLLAVVLPVEEGERLLEMVSANKEFVVKRVCKVKTVLSKPPKRYLIELCMLKNTLLVAKDAHFELKQETLVIQQKGGECYTQEYNELVKRFYLKELKTD